MNDTERDLTVIDPYSEVKRQLYAYTLPEVPSHDGFVKIGDTTQAVNQRIIQQVGTVGLNPDLLFTRLARRSDGTWFRDHDFHRYLRLNGIEAKDFNKSAREWFDFGDHVDRAEDLADKYIALDYDEVQLPDGDTDYVLRQEQAQAVEETLAYIRDDKTPREFLWNAKPRFGKTLSTYDLIRHLKTNNVLIVTNRPAIANSWYDDFEKFIASKEPQMKFVTNGDTLKDKGLSRDEFMQLAISSDEDIQQIVFLSLQDLKGAEFAGGPHKKLEWVGQLDWDLLVIDEAHEGVDTVKTDKAFDQLKRHFTLHLSGTPFKQLASDKFRADQIFNWSYVDEQTAKENWSLADGHNPYETLPTMNLFTYQMSDIVRQDVSGGLALDEDTNVDYAFDLNEFFRVKDNGRFEYEDDVKRFLDNLSSGKFPFSPDQHRAELDHTFWLLPRVAAAKALEKLLNQHPVFKDYQTILAAGDGVSLVDDGDQAITEGEAQSYTANTKSFERVRQAIDQHDQTITLSVGQLTTGVTIPEWTAVLMLNNIKSPALYFQAAFRAQNPHQFVKAGELIQKENAYIFDFAPVRTLQLYSEFAQNLSGERTATTQDQHDRIKTLLNFFPVIAEDEGGEMKAIDAGEVMTIPNKMVSREVVKQGFMSNLLFANVSGIFAPNSRLKEIIDKIQPEENKRLQNRREINLTNPSLDEHGNVAIAKHLTEDLTQDIFGDKIWQADAKVVEVLNDQQIDTRKKESNLVDMIVDNLDTDKLFENFDITRKGQQRTIEDNIKEGVQNRVERNHLTMVNQVREIDSAYAIKIEALEANQDQAEAEKVVQRQVLDQERDSQIQAAQDNFITAVQDDVETVLAQEVRNQQVNSEEKKKKVTEDDTRDHLRGFARTIPSFLMAYGDDDTTLANFERRIDADTFEELTSITIDEFKLLRDGYYDQEMGKEIPGVFNEIVFDESIKEFNQTKDRLANYFDRDQEEDIFDYIPPQKTNQIFTPKAVVKMMVDALEEENPGIFTNKDLKFADLYAKSGLYMTEVVTRLFQGLADEIPDDKERLDSIFNNQIYIATPTNILYNIVKNFVYGDDLAHLAEGHLIEVDTAKLAQEGRLADEIEAYFGKEGEQVKFDVIIGNPPYQEELAGGNLTKSKPVYHKFLDSAYEIADIVEVIHPARFLNNAGDTPKKWNNKMLNDTHLKIVFFEANAANIFPNTDIKGGVVVSYRDKNQDFGAIEIFIANENLKSILKKTKQSGNDSLSTLIFPAGSYKFEKTKVGQMSNPEYVKSVGCTLKTNAFDKLPEDFCFEKPNDNLRYARILGLYQRERIKKYIRTDFLAEHPNLDKYKVVLPFSNGSGEFGERLSSPSLEGPGVGHTQTVKSTILCKL